jgi:hypothetical protein
MNHSKGLPIPQLLAVRSLVLLSTLLALVA